ncbi:MAG: TolC family protein [Flavobacteriales bacterium]|nr:TolC family protein [Flavobacteriales bacterium]
MKKLLLATYFVATSGLFLAQETQSFSLEQAQAYALEHNYEKSNADNDLLIAKKKVWETTGIGLPQVKAEAKLQNFIDIPTSLVPANTFNPAAPADEYLALKFGTDYNNSVGVTATQLLFDGSYLVGLRASKVYKEFAEKNVAKTEIEVKEQVAQAYYLALVAEENKRILEESAKTTQDLLNQSTKIFEEGLMEEQNVDQLKLTLNDINSSLANASRQISIAKNLLKFQIGYDISSEIVLTDNIETLLAFKDKENALTNEFDFNNHIDYQIMKSNEQLMKLNWSKEKFSFTPSLVAFFNHTQQNMSNEFDMFSGGSWYPQTLWGLTLSVPIILGSTRFAKTSQAKISYQMAQNNTRKVEQGLLLQAQQKQADYTSALDIYNNQKEGLEIAGKINNQSIKKYNEGIISSMELAQTQTQYLQTEGKYIKALLDLFNAKSELNKALGTN